MAARSLVIPFKATIDGGSNRQRPVSPARRRKTNIASDNYLGMFRAKVLVIGPCESGKTVLSNFLADATEMSSGEYYPTVGVRILEFDVESVATKQNRSANVDVELWDCSGDNKYENCWPAIQKDVNGIVFVINPGNNGQVKNLDKWHVHFVSQLGLKDSQCIVFVHHKSGRQDNSRANLSSAFSRMKVVDTNLEEDPDSVKEEFKHFLGDVLSNLADRRDQEELSIVNNRQAVY
eukprot:gene13823-15268_t